MIQVCVTRLAHPLGTLLHDHVGGFVVGADNSQITLNWLDASDKPDKILSQFVQTAPRDENVSDWTIKMIWCEVGRCNPVSKQGFAVTNPSPFPLFGQNCMYCLVKSLLYLAMLSGWLSGWMLEFLWLPCLTTGKANGWSFAPDTRWGTITSFSIMVAEVMILTTFNGNASTHFVYMSVMYLFLKLEGALSRSVRNFHLLSGWLTLIIKVHNLYTTTLFIAHIT